MTIKKLISEYGLYVFMLILGFTFLIVSITMTYIFFTTHILMGVSILCIFYMTYLIMIKLKHNYWFEVVLVMIFLLLFFAYIFYYNYDEDISTAFCTEYQTKNNVSTEIVRGSFWSWRNNFTKCNIIINETNVDACEFNITTLTCNEDKILKSSIGERHENK